MYIITYIDIYARILYININKPQYIVVGFIGFGMVYAPFKAPLQSPLALPFWHVIVTASASRPKAASLGLPQHYAAIASFSAAMTYLSLLASSTRSYAVIVSPLRVRRVASCCA